MTCPNYFARIGVSDEAVRAKVDAAFNTIFFDPEENVFHQLEDGTDGEAFMQTLKDNADMRWNICVEAEETVVGQSGNKVFFVMCPTSLEG